MHLDEVLIALKELEQEGMTEMLDPGQYWSRLKVVDKCFTACSRGYVVAKRSVPEGASGYAPFLRAIRNRIAALEMEKSIAPVVGSPVARGYAVVKPKQEFDVMVSYSGDKGRNIALEVQEGLQLLGRKVFVSDLFKEGGISVYSLYSVAAKTKNMVIVCNEDLSSSVFCHNEIAYALLSGNRVVPLVEERDCRIEKMPWLTKIMAIARCDYNDNTSLWKALNNDLNSSRNFDYWDLALEHILNVCRDEAIYDLGRKLSFVKNIELEANPKSIIDKIVGEVKRNLMYVDELIIAMEPTVMFR